MKSRGCWLKLAQAVLRQRIVDALEDRGAEWPERRRQVEALVDQAARSPARPVAAG